MGLAILTQIPKIGQFIWLLGDEGSDDPDSAARQHVVTRVAERGLAGCHCGTVCMLQDLLTCTHHHHPPLPNICATHNLRTPWQTAMRQLRTFQEAILRNEERISIDWVHLQKGGFLLNQNT